MRLIDMGHCHWGSVVARAVYEMSLLLMRDRITIAPETDKLLLAEWL